jgi:hypothetical protein
MLPRGIFTQGTDPGTGFLNMSQGTTPLNPFDGSVSLFAQDAGGGLTRLIAVFPGNEIIVLATEVTP